tara:strand:- start:131 stop:535 length:405 start_codon:yes stop_codon:yes gene_type:complete
LIIHCAHPTAKPDEHQEESSSEGGEPSFAESKDVKRRIVLGIAHGGVFGRAEAGCFRGDVGGVVGDLIERSHDRTPFGDGEFWGGLRGGHRLRHRKLHEGRERKKERIIITTTTTGDGSERDASLNRRAEMLPS